VADRLGRRPVLIAGLVLYTGASALAMLASRIDWLIVCRAAQGVGMAACVMCARAMLRDFYAPQEGARVLARAMVWMSAIPVLGPMLGGVIETTLGWRGAFATLTAFGAVGLLFVVLRLPESIERHDPHALRFSALARSWAEIMHHPTFWAYTAVASFTYAGLFSFIAGSSFVLVDVLGLTRREFGVTFSLVVSGYLVGSFWCQRLIPQRGLVRTIRLGASLSLVGGLSMAALALAGVHHPLALAVPQFVYMVAHGIHQPCAHVGAVGPFPARAGTAAALSGFLCMALAFAVGSWIGWSFDGTVYPLALTIAFWSVLLAYAALVLVRRHGETRVAAP
jgi:DHA1 family bicyclomycin/chloramphenicol resistance-like MFS transporter